MSGYELRWQSSGIGGGIGSGNSCPDAPVVGSWAEDVPPAPLSQAARTLELDLTVDRLKTRPGVWRLVDLAVGRGGGCSSSLRTRGCQIRTRHRHETGHTEIWARWPGDGGD